VDPLAALGRGALFRGVEPTRLEPLLTSLVRRRVPKGAHLFHEGDPGNHLYLVVSGQVKISRTGRDGVEAVRVMLLPGDLFGELALLDESAARTTDAEAVEDTECLALDRVSLLGFLDAHPEMMRSLIAVLIGYIRRLDDALLDMASLDIPGRVALKLLELVRTHGVQTSDGVRIRMRLSQRALAGMIGASRENVNRTVGRMVTEGAIRWQDGQVTVLRQEALRRRTWG
jgi:CRP/FNR family transcriptional regulator